ncbi:MAG TPA: glycosyltransferase, partial [Candidatus Obscuribacterales bacterium]
LDPRIEAIPAWWILRGEIARHQGQPKQAAEYYQQARSLVRRPDFAQSNPVIAQADLSWKPLLGLAQAQQDEGMFSQAYLHFSQLHAQLSNKQEVLDGLIKASFFIRRYDTMLQILEQSGPLLGISPTVRDLLAQLPALMSGKTPTNLEALVAQSEAETPQLSSDTFLVSVLIEFSVGLLQRGRHDLAQGMIKALLEQVPDQPLLWHNLALTYFARKEYAQAESYYRRALELDPGYFLSHFDLVKVLVMQNRKLEALTELYQLRQRHPQDPQVRQAIKQLEAEAPRATQASDAPYIFVFPVNPDWENGADLALQAYYQEFVAEDRVALAFVAKEQAGLLAKAKAWAESSFSAELLAPVVWLEKPLPMLPQRSAWILPWRLQPGAELREALSSSGYPLISTDMQLLQPAGQPLPARVMTETSGERRRVWLEAEVAALANQMRLAVNGVLKGQGQPRALQTHDLLPLSRGSEARVISYQEPVWPEGPGISVCMIVRDEAAVLARCLDSVQDQVEEIIVVDTGSRDSTREIAAGYPKVRLFEKEWTGDFAAARNEAVSHASQPWILALDADEYVQPGFIDSIRPYLHQSSQPDAYTFPVLALDSQGQQIPGQSLMCVPRLFPNQPVYTYRGRIHEMIFHQERESMRYYFLEQLPILHTGYQAEVVAAKQKHQRDTELLEGMIREQPEAKETQRMYVILAGLYRGAGEYERSLACIEAGLKVARDSLVRGMLLRRQVQMLYQLGRDAELLEISDPQDPYVAMYRSQSLHRLGRITEALEAAQLALQLVEAQALQPDPLALMLHREDILRDLSMVAEKNRDWELALYYFKRHLKLSPSEANWEHYKKLKQGTRG